MSARQNAVEGWSPEDSVESAREGMVGQRATLAIVSICCSVFDHSVRPSSLQSGRERLQSPAEQRRGAVVAAATTRAAARAMSGGAAGEEGELSAKKRRLKDRAVGAASFSYRKKIMVGVGAVDSDVEWRRLRWQRRMQGRKRPLRLGRSATVVAVEALLWQKEEDESNDYHDD
ncbi:hypothetical protein B296_00028707 [Ensete ventricosum]|uniref:Uncharacterized protein n=1 Tax=Ensete ventricosum TaxID=4639 RepID=A0A426YH41_ENSVE|nr:hypothetical protein B296_00028707 [Ensete ventricosum]